MRERVFMFSAEDWYDLEVRANEALANLEGVLISLHYIQSLDREVPIRVIITYLPMIKEEEKEKVHEKTRKDRKQSKKSNA